MKLSNTRYVTDCVPEGITLIAACLPVCSLWRALLSQRGHWPSDANEGEMSEAGVTNSRRNWSLHDLVTPRRVPPFRTLDSTLRAPFSLSAPLARR